MQWCLAAHNGRLDSLPYYALSWTLTSISVVEPGKIFSSLSEIIATSLFADRRYLSLVPLTCRSIDYIGTKGLYENSWCVVAEASSQLVTSHKSSHSQIVTALIRFTRADDSGGSKAFIRVCLYVYSSARQNQNGWTIITKLPTDIIHHEATHLILDQKVKGQGHRVTKCKNILVEGNRMAVVSLHSIECSRLVIMCYYLLSFGNQLLYMADRPMYNVHNV